MQRKDMEPTVIGPGNHSGSLKLKVENGVPYWSVEDNYSGHDWEPIEGYLADALVTFRGERG